jgi:hypothetical protein
LSLSIFDFDFVEVIDAEAADVAEGAAAEDEMLETESDDEDPFDGCLGRELIPKVAGVCLMIGSTLGAIGVCLAKPEKPENGFELDDIDPKELNVFLTGASDDSRLSLMAGIRRRQENISLNHLLGLIIRRAAMTSSDARENTPGSSVWSSKASSSSGRN